MFYFACPCGRQGPRDSGEDLLVLYLIRNPLDPSDTIDVALPWPFCHLVVRVIVIAESKAAKPILRCAHDSTRIEMTMEERTLSFPILHSPIQQSCQNWSEPVHFTTVACTQSTWTFTSP